jgi:Flp pilus assembly protein TadG
MITPKLRSGAGVTMKRLSIKALRVTAWGRQVAAGAKRKACAGARDERGVVAIIFALSLVVLAPLILGLFDIYTASEQRAKLQDALDAAALYAARSDYMTDAEISTAGTKALNANLQLIRGATLISSSFHLTDNNTKVTASATIQPMALAPGFWAHPSVTASTEATRSSKNLEVALVLDITNSMNSPSSKIADLRTAAQDLVDLVVKDQQTPYYSKVAVVPWSVGVNVGTYAAQVRGAITPKTITGATKANPVVITAANHGFNNNDIVYIDSSVGGMTQIRDTLFTVKNKTANTFQLYTMAGATVNGTSYSAFTSGGGVSCTTTGCPYYRFVNGDNSATKTFKLSTCVSERIGAQAYTDAAPSTALVGVNYPAQTGVAGTAIQTQNPCPTNTIVPLSTDKTAVKAMIAGLQATASTGGQVGVAWGWYMLSPNFAYLWPSASQPGPYNDDDTMKVVVLMTDGALNTAYCNGVIAKDSLTGSGDIKDHSNCNATNGSTFSQSTTLCTNMKAAGIIVYTVGFQISGDVPATNLMNSCATDPAHVYLPTTGSALQDAFHAIGQDINGLHLSH